MIRSSAAALVEDLNRKRVVGETLDVKRPLSLEAQCNLWWRG